MSCLITGGDGSIKTHHAEDLITQSRYEPITYTTSVGRPDRVTHLLHYDRFYSAIADILDV